MNWMAAALDLAGQPRIDQGGSQTVDIGCYEHPARQVPAVPDLPATGDFFLAYGGNPAAALVVPADADDETLKAVEDLARYVALISGAHLPLFSAPPAPLPQQTVWIGYHDELPGLFPQVDFTFQHPEETLQLCNGNHLALLGHDWRIGDKQLEFGTANAVYAFIEKRLAVRWLWPGSLGEEYPESPDISIPVFTERYHPQLRMRSFHRINPGGIYEPLLTDWFKRQRNDLMSARFTGGHAFTDWWDRYSAQHPLWFALRSNGERTPGENPRTVKLCVSNPEVPEQWLQNSVSSFNSDPSLLMLSASPNDGSGFCVCENCRAWDAPDGPPYAGYVALTDRYAKFWNILASGLRDRLPEREAWVGALAYTANQTPPVHTMLEPNIIIGLVGHFPVTPASGRAAQHEHWLGWAQRASRMWYRPNYWYWGGGLWGMPETTFTHAGEDFSFLAQNRCEGLEVDTLRGIWATQGPMYYLLAKLAYEPHLDAEEVMQDYFVQGFDAAAPYVAAYWQLLEDAYCSMMARPDYLTGSGNRFKLPPIFAETYSLQLLSEAGALLDQAAARVADAPVRFSRRVEFTRAGYEYLRLMMETIPLMARARESSGKDREAVLQAAENWYHLGMVVENAGQIAMGTFSRLASWIGGSGYMGAMGDYLGPPSEALLIARGNYYVAQNGQTPAVPYDNWHNAASNIQEAVNQAAVGATVWVAPGIYGCPPEPHVTDGVTNMVNLNKLLTLRSVSGKPGDTVIDAGGQAGNRCLRIYTQLEERDDYTIRVSGFTLTNGNASGGGILFAVSSWVSTGIVENCVIEGNSNTSGPGLYSYYNGGTGPLLVLSNCVIRNHQQGGFYARFPGDLQLLRSRIINNSPFGLTRDHVYSSSSRTLIEGCIFSGNSKIDTNNGAAVDLIRGSTTFRNCLFYGNHFERWSSGNGGAAIALNTTTAEVQNCTIADNTARGVSGALPGLYAPRNTEFLIKNSILYGNYRDTSHINYGGSGSYSFINSCTTPITGYGNAGNIGVDPDFANAGASDFHLRQTSPCINAGINESWMEDARDLDGRARLDRMGPGVVDMGCYEYPIQSSLFLIR